MKIAILTPNKSLYTETFISNHITYLPFEKVVIYGGRFPSFSDSAALSRFEVYTYHLMRFLKGKLGFKTKTIQELRLRKILRKEKVDVVFSEYLFTGAEVTPVCKELGIPVVSIALGYEISKYEMIEKYREKYRVLFQYAEKIFVVSNHMRKNILDIGCSEEKIVYTPAGPAKEFFDLHPKFKTKQIFALGRFVDKKAPYLTVMAFKEVLKKHPDAVLVMGGDGELLQVCKDLVHALDIEDAVVFKGRIDQSEQLAILENSYAFVQHSKVAESGDSEGTPVAILEASASGIPVVSTNHAGIPDVIKHGITGLLSEENDVAAMAENLISLLDDPELAKQMGTAGKKRVKENFSLENHIEILRREIEKCLR
jgi:glycosyltransferase involved in cell wall biosynthesis